MSSRLAKQSLELLISSPSKKTNNQVEPKKKIKLPKVNKGIKKVKYEIRYGVHKKTRQLQEERKKRENPVDVLHDELLSKEEQLKRNVQIMRKALRSSQLEKEIHKQVIKERDAKRSKKWSNKVNGSDEDTDDDSD